MKKVLINMIKFYRKFISPIKGYLLFIQGPSCRFTPTCSQYAIEAIEKYGALKGSFIAFKRILRCNPFFEGGYDPVK